jgi:hypothetical protein
MVSVEANVNSQPHWRPDWKGMFYSVKCLAQELDRSTLESRFFVVIIPVVDLGQTASLI